MTNSSHLPDTWPDLLQLLDQPLDIMDASLNSDLFAARRNLYLKQDIAMMISGSISVIFSMLLIIHILRSHEYLSTTYHRMVLGSSTADVISSFGFVISPTMTPKEMRYLVPFASGNVATCDAMGFSTCFSFTASVAVLQLFHLFLFPGNHYLQ